jgi:hypothetical protein
MNEITALNDKIRHALGERRADDSTLMVKRDDRASDLTILPRVLRDELEQLRRVFDRLIPPDFGYTLFLGDQEPSCAVTYDDGPMTQFSSGIPIAKWLSVADQLSDINWTAIRAMALSGSGIFDEIVQHGGEAPENIPLTERLQEKFQTETESFHNGRNDPDCVHALVWDDFQGLQQESFADLADLERQLPDLMTCCQQVVAVVAQAKALQPERIDRMKRRALDKLKDMPISYAQASGRLSPPTVLDR